MVAKNAKPEASTASEPEKNYFSDSSSLSDSIYDSWQMAQSENLESESPFFLTASESLRFLSEYESYKESAASEIISQGSEMASESIIVEMSESESAEPRSKHPLSDFTHAAELLLNKANAFAQSKEE